jgi:hypothetical protein
VAATTVPAELVVVNVVSAVATSAIVVDCFHLVELAAMAVIARDANVGTDKREVGLRIVVKDPQFPGDRIVTGVATSCEVAAVRIVFCVTAGAGILDIFE